MHRCSHINKNGLKCKRNSSKETDFCTQHNPLKKIEDDTCSICLESINNPMTIGCTHVFCKECISKSIIFGVAQSQIAKCPNCRAGISMDKTIDAVEICCGERSAKLFKLRLDMATFPWKWQKPSNTWTREMKRLVNGLS